MTCEAWRAVLLSETVKWELEFRWAGGRMVGLSRQHHPRSQLSMAHCHRSVSQGNRRRGRAWLAAGLRRKALDRNPSGGSGRGEVELGTLVAEVSADPMRSSGAGMTFKDSCLRLGYQSLHVPSPPVIGC